MATLHLIHAAPIGSDVVERCFAASRPGDAVLFYGRGVLAVSVPRAEAPVGVRLYAHRDDARALHVAHRIDDSIALIDDDEFVSLVVGCDRSVAWN